MARNNKKRNPQTKDVQFPTLSTVRGVEPLTQVELIPPPAAIEHAHLCRPFSRP
jgi:hypothetical protein